MSNGTAYPIDITKHSNLYRVRLTKGKPVKPTADSYQAVSGQGGRDRSAAKTLLFVHGMEYHHPKEVIRDLVAPFLENCSTSSRIDPEETQILFFYWPSCIAPPTGKQRHSSMVPDMLRKLVRTTSNGWSRELATRIHASADRLSALIDQAQGPIDLSRTTVVTHSLGASVWAMAAKQLIAYQSPAKVLDLGDWISLQPALQANAFGQAEMFSSVASNYAACARPITVVHSRFDLVLKLMYRMTVGQPAMGEIGCNAHGVRSVDVSTVVAEAHGTFRLGKRSGCFFRRAAKVIDDLMLQTHFGQPATPLPRQQLAR